MTVYIFFLTTFVLSRLQNDGVLSPGLCRERLDMSLVAGVGLISDKPSFDKKEVRARTGLLYVSLPTPPPISILVFIAGLQLQTKQVQPAP